MPVFCLSWKVLATIRPECVPYFIELKTVSYLFLLLISSQLTTFIRVLPKAKTVELSTNNKKKILFLSPCRFFLLVSDIIHVLKRFFTNAY
jgi:hypothetical protein